MSDSRADPRPRDHHDRDHHDRDHGHPPHQPDLEDRPRSPYQAMSEALGELLIEKGLFSADDLRRTIESIDARNPAAGSRLIARAWVDPKFRARVLADVNEAAAELGIDPGPVPIRAIANEPKVHNLIVCTLCSCYPRFLIGLPPDWYKSRAYRSRAIREPRAVIAEFGGALPEDVEVRVHDSTANLRYLVLPMRPPGTEGLSEAELARRVGRDAMIGVEIIDR